MLVCIFEFLASHCHSHMHGMFCVKVDGEKGRNGWISMCKISSWKCLCFDMMVDLFVCANTRVCVCVPMCIHAERREKNFCHVPRSRLCNVHRSSFILCTRSYVPKSNKQSVVMATNTFYDSLHRNSSEMMRVVYLLPTKHICTHVHKHKCTYIKMV